MQNITVWGGGSWGTALAQVLACAGHKVSIYLRDPEQAAYINAQHKNPKYLIGQALDPSISATCDSQILAQSQFLVLAVPSQSLRSELKNHYALLAQNSNLVLIQSAKGIELSSLKTMQTLVAEELAGIEYAYSALSGPSFALETVQGKPTAVVLACADKALGKSLRSIFSTSFFRAYSSPDVRGVELGGALKNIIAIACGLSDGLGFGHNARAALMTRGLAEISRLGQSLGANSTTFMGLSGMGDLFLTCTGDLSRNRQVGLKLAQGQSLQEIIASMQMVAEGVKTTEAVYKLAQSLQIEMPITEATYNILEAKISPHEGVKLLMTRNLKEEQE